MGTPQLGGMQPSGQAAWFPASLPGAARAPPPPSRRQATTAVWGQGAEPGLRGLGKGGAGGLDSWILGRVMVCSGTKGDRGLFRGGILRREQNPPASQGSQLSPGIPMPSS